MFLPHAWGSGYTGEAFAAALDWFAGALPCGRRSRFAPGRSRPSVSPQDAESGHSGPEQGHTRHPSVRSPAAWLLVTQLHFVDRRGKPRRGQTTAKPIGWKAMDAAGVVLIAVGGSALSPRVAARPPGPIHRRGVPTAGCRCA